MICWKRISPSKCGCWLSRDRSVAWPLVTANVTEVVGTEVPGWTFLARCVFASVKVVNTWLWSTKKGPALARPFDSQVLFHFSLRPQA